MKKSIVYFAGVIAMLSASRVFPTTPGDLMSQAMASGKASGVLTGSIADDLKTKTRSIDPTQAVIERIGSDADKCQVFTVTLTQPNVPTRSGGNAGDYTTVTKTKLCPDNREFPPEVIDCRVGNVSCMPPTAK